MLHRSDLPQGEPRLSQIVDPEMRAVYARLNSMSPAERHARSRAIDRMDIPPEPLNPTLSPSEPLRDECLACGKPHFKCKMELARTGRCCCGSCDHPHLAGSEKNGFMTADNELPYMPRALAAASPTNPSSEENQPKKGKSYSSLDEQETPVETPRVSTASQRLLFMGAELERHLAIQAVAASGAAPGVLESINNCCDHAVVLISPSTGRRKLGAFYCRSRICPRCARLRREAYATKLIQQIGLIKPHQWRLITLTLRSSDEPLADQLSTLGASFRRLRQQGIWRRGVIRAKATFEVTWNEEKHQWHPHLHIIAEGRYIDQAELSDAWGKASNGSTIVDIRPVRNAAGGVRYVCKYMGKAPNLTEASDPIERMTEYYMATHNRKLILHVGKWPDIEEPADADQAEDDPADWIVEFHVNDLYARAAAHDAEARRMIRVIAANLDELLAGSFKNSS